MNWKMLLLMVLPMLEMVGQQKIDEDANDTGKDDMIGISIQYACKLLRAVVTGGTLPKAPDALK